MQKKYRLVSTTLLLMLALGLMLSAPLTSAQDTEWELTETVHLMVGSYTTTYTEFGFSYPQGWLYRKEANIALINELEVDQGHPIDEAYMTEGYSIRYVNLRPNQLQELPPTTERTLDDLVAFIVSRYGFQEPMEVTETNLETWPALQIRTVDNLGNHIVSIQGYFDTGKTIVFVLTLMAPSEEALDAFLPTWEAMLPVPTYFPEPTGPYEIGVTSRHWVDEARDETFSEDPDDYRELMVYIWYPADVNSEAEYAPYFEVFSGPDGDEALEAWPALTWMRVDISSPEFQELLQWKKHAFMDVPVADSQDAYPIAIFSPGLGGMPEGHATQLEELASHGYVVVGVNHPYCSGVTVFPDGHKYIGIDNSQALEMTCAEDILFVIDQLEQINQDDPESQFTGKLDLERIGVFGHSLGGWVVAIAGSLDDRIIAVINEDGPRIPPDYDASKLQQPFMYFRASSNASYPSAGGNITIVVDGFEHLSFTDDPIWPLRIPYIGSVHGNRTVDIVRAYVLAFFDRYLKGELQPMLFGPSKDYPIFVSENYPEVIVETQRVFSSEELQEVISRIMQDAADSEVTELDLSSLGLNTLPPDIGQLTNLQKLILSDNAFTTLPPDIGRLTNLQELIVIRNRLTSLPPEIGQLTNLQKLILSGNDLTILPPEIGQLTSLQQLSLARNQLTSLPPEIAQLTSLQTLSLAENNFDALTSEIVSLPSLQKLFLNDNQLTLLTPEIGQLTNLQTLNVAENNLTQLPEELCDLELLDRLIVSNNPLSSDSPTDADQLEAWCQSR